MGALHSSLSLVNVHFNVGMDGIHSDAYGLFREISGSNKFSEVLENIQMIGRFFLKIKYYLYNAIFIVKGRSIRTGLFYSLCKMRFTVKPITRWSAFGE